MRRRGKKASGSDKICVYDSTSQHVHFFRDYANPKLKEHTEKVLKSQNNVIFAEASRKRLFENVRSCSAFYFNILNYCWMALDRKQEAHMIR